MTTFPDDQNQRPLFEEPTNAIERVDDWQEPLGFLIGGMANLSLQQLGEQYFDAANVLTEIIQKRAWEDYRLANPTLFLYRHSIELLLKAAMGRMAKGHNLDKLSDEFVIFAKREWGTTVPGWIITRIKELAKVDPGSTAFRYSENWDKMARKTVPVDGEFYVDLLYLRHAMHALKTALDEFLDAHKVQ